MQRGRNIVTIYIVLFSVGKIQSRFCGFFLYLDDLNIDFAVYSFVFANACNDFLKKTAEAFAMLIDNKPYGQL